MEPYVWNYHTKSPIKPKQRSKAGGPMVHPIESKSSRSPQNSRGEKWKLVTNQYTAELEMSVGELEKVVVAGETVLHKSPQDYSQEYFTQMNQLVQTGKLILEGDRTGTSTGSCSQSHQNGNSMPGNVAKTEGRYEID